LFDLSAGCYADVMINENVNVYPAQPMAVLDNNAGDACSGDVGILSVNLVGADGTSVCDNQTFDAPINQTCAATTETVNYSWSVADIEGLTTAPTALACYTAVMGNENIDVYPEQLIANVVNVIDACVGTAEIVTLQLFKMLWIIIQLLTRKLYLAHLQELVVIQM